MKLIIQIPCYNEEDSLPATLADLPEKLPGITKIEVLIIDDGSTDETIRIAKQHGVRHILSLQEHRGLAVAFSEGLSYALKQGADIIVNTDADNQYAASSMSELIAPVLNGEVDITIGTRPIANHPEFSCFKKKLQWLGSAVVRVLSGTNVQDAPSGFRAISARAARQIHIFSPYTYTLEMILQAGIKGISVKSVPIRVNTQLRPSRLMVNTGQYVARSLTSLLDITLLYRPRRVFSLCAAPLIAASLLLGLRFLYFHLTESESGKVQSLILAAILFTSGGALFITGLLANIIAKNRILLEKNSERLMVLEHTLNRIDATLKRLKPDSPPS